MSKIIDLVLKFMNNKNIDDKIYEQLDIASEILNELNKLIPNNIKTNKLLINKSNTGYNLIIFDYMNNMKVMKNLNCVKEVNTQKYTEEEAETLDNKNPIIDYCDFCHIFEPLQSYVENNGDLHLYCKACMDYRTNRNEYVDKMNLIEKNDK